MSRAQKILILAATLIGLGMILYPPWVEYYFSDDTGTGRKEHGRHFIWDKPPSTPGVKPRGPGMRIYSSELSKYLIGLGIATFVGYVLLGSKTGQEKRDGPAAE